MASEEEIEVGRERIRAAKACQRCNQRRIKCDASEHGIPCTKCRQHGKVECRFIQSRRGTYPRKKARRDTAKDANNNTFTASEQPSSGEAVVSSTGRNETIEQTSTAAAPAATELTDQCESANAQAAVEMRQSTCNEASANVQDTAAPTPGTLSFSIDESDTPQTNKTETSESSYREISWTAMFDHFLASRRQPRREIVDKCSITYLGESFPLALVLEDMSSSGMPQLHHPGPPLEAGLLGEEQAKDPEHPAHMQPEDVDFLRAKQAFTYPDDQTLAVLMSTFAERFFPLYPVVNLQEFLAQYRAKTMPWILLHAACFVAATYCPISVLYRAGFAGRKQARISYYKKAKALFDTGFESNKIVILQTTILLTFWGGGPNNYWNFYSWIGTGVTIAETLGIHRSLSGTNMKPQDRSLLKRLWWTLIIRDTSCGALVGRPFRINMDHSDTEMLTSEDFEQDAAHLLNERHPLASTFGLYQVCMSSLSLIQRQIINCRFRPGMRSQSVANLNAMLLDWRGALPLGMNWPDLGAGSNVLTSSLAILYNQHLILLHLQRQSWDKYMQSMIGSNMGTSMSSQNVVELAAHRIAALASSIVTRSQVLQAPHEAFHGLFMAEVVFYAQMKSAQPMIAQLGRTALDGCQMVLHGARESWDPAPWVMQLFENLISNSKDEAAQPAAAAPSGLQSPIEPLGNMYRSNDPNGIVSQPPGGVADLGSSGMADFTGFQNNSMLSTFFDLSNDADAFTGLDYLGFPSYGDFDPMTGVT